MHEDYNMASKNSSDRKKLRALSQPCKFKLEPAVFKAKHADIGNRIADGLAITPKERKNYDRHDGSRGKNQSVVEEGEHDMMSCHRL